MKLLTLCLETAVACREMTKIHPASIMFCAQRRRYKAARSAALSVCETRVEIVIGPTPPGTGVSAEHRAARPSVCMSPTPRSWYPASMTAVPCRAATRRSPVLRTLFRLFAFAPVRPPLRADPKENDPLQQVTRGLVVCAYGVNTLS